MKTPKWLFWGLVATVYVLTISSFIQGLALRQHHKEIADLTAAQARSDDYHDFHDIVFPAMAQIAALLVTESTPTVCVAPNDTWVMRDLKLQCQVVRMRPRSDDEQLSWAITLIVSNTRTGFNRKAYLGLAGNGEVRSLVEASSFPGGEEQELILPIIH
jgi:hypothetical protein